MKNAFETFKKPLGIGALLLATALAGAHAADFTVSGPDGKPLPQVMVTRVATQSAAIDDSDNGYAAHGKLQQGTFEHTGFTDEKGRVKLSMKALMERPAGDHQGAEHQGERHSNHQHADEAQQQQQQQ